MSKVSILGAAVLIVGLLLTASGAHAVPTLQVYLEGATYDTTTETWVMAGGFTGGSARLWVIGNTGSVGTIENVHIAAAFDSAYAPEIILTPAAAGTYAGFSDPSVAALPTTNGLLNTGTPIMDSGRPLPAHDIYGDGMVWEQFDLGDLSLTDSQIADFAHGFPTSFEGMGQINVYDLTVTGDLPEDFFIHFDVYNHVAGETRSVFAPFSHDAEFQPTEEEFPPVPEPLSMVMFGCVGAGMIAARKLRRRNS